MIDGLHIPIWNRTRESLAIALSGVGRGLGTGNHEGNVINVQHKSNQNCYYETPPVSSIYPNKNLLKKDEIIESNQYDDGSRAYLTNQSWLTPSSVKEKQLLLWLNHCFILPLILTNAAIKQKYYVCVYIHTLD
jgi:hypothetical protein